MGLLVNGEWVDQWYDTSSNKGEFKRHKPMVWEFHGYGTQLAVMDGPWKAIRQKVRTKKPGPWELYNLDDDPNEKTNLAKKHPEILERLKEASKTDRTPSPRAPLKIYDEQVRSR